MHNGAVDEKKVEEIKRVRTKEDFEKLLSFLKEEGFPAFRTTLSRLRLHGSYDKITVAQLARRILEDPGLSAKLLKVANSPVFNPGLYRIRTVTRAIVMLGLKNVSTIVHTLAFLEDALQHESLRGVIGRVVKAMKKGELAKHFAELTGNSLPEEVFIGGLMYDLGEIIYAAFVDHDVRTEISRIAAEKKVSEEVIQRKILGFSTRDVTNLLNKEWKVSLILDDLFTSREKSVQAKMVEYASEIVNITETDEQDTEKLQALFKDMSSELGIPLKTVLKCVKKAGEDFQRLEGVYEQNIKEQKHVKKDVTRKSLVEEEASSEILSAVNYQRLQEIFEILQDIVSMIFKGFSDPNLLFSLVMEAIYDGLDMDVALFGLLSTDRRGFQIRHSLVRPGTNNVKIPDVITFKNPHMNLFVDLLNYEDALWINKESSLELLAKANSIPASRIIHIPCFLMPVRPKQKTIGFIYADGRNNKDDNLNETSFTIFTMFGKLAAIGLSFLTTETN